MTKHPHEVWRNSPDPTHYELLGLAIIEYGHLEAALCLLFQHFTGVGPEISYAISGHLRGRHLTAILRSVIPVSSRSEDEKSEALWILEQLPALGENRDRYVHAEWMSGPRGAGTGKLFSGKRPPHYSTPVAQVTAAELKKFAGALADLTWRCQYLSMAPEERAKIQPSIAPRPWPQQPKARASKPA